MTFPDTAAGNRNEMFWQQTFAAVSFPGVVEGEARATREDFFVAAVVVPFMTDRS